MKSIKEIKNLSGKRVLVRVAFNVPVKDGKVIDDFRIKKSLKTIKYLQSKNAKIILMSHLGEDEKESFKPIISKFKKYIPKLVFLDKPIFSDETEDAIKNLKKGDIVLLENLRKEKGEKDNSPSFARALSRYGDIYINDDFPVSHRAHASIVGITKYLPGYAGFQFEEEVKNLSTAFSAKHPFLFILGGAKFSTKIPLIKKFLHDADNVFIGGALANDFLKAKGYEIGYSLVEEGNFEIKSLLKNKKLILPRDVEVVKGNSRRFTKSESVLADENIVDIGPETLSNLKDLVLNSKFVLWNGPLGKYGVGSGKPTEELLKLIAKSKKVKSVIGGGDTIAYISKLKLEKKLGFVSTGGGATLDFLSKGTLPGIKALK